MNKNKVKLLLVIVCVLIYIVYNTFFQCIKIIHLSKEDTLEYGNYKTKYYFLDHFKNWDEDAKALINDHFKEEIKYLKNGNELSLVYIINDKNLLNRIIGDYDNYLEDGIENLSTDEIVAQCYIIKDSIGGIRFQSVDFKDR